MRWLACFVLLTGCVRARATVVHPTDNDNTTGGGGPSTIAREANPQPQPPRPSDRGTNLGSIELGGLVPLNASETTRVHIAPGIRIFDSQMSTVLWGVAIGADFESRHRGPGFALEGSLHLGSSSDPKIIEQALDLFGGVTVHSSRASGSIAIGPSVGILAMPGGSSVVMVGLGLRVAGRRD